MSSMNYLRYLYCPRIHLSPVPSVHNVYRQIAGYLNLLLSHIHLLCDVINVDAAELNIEKIKVTSVEKHTLTVCPGMSLVSQPFLALTLRNAGCFYLVVFTHPNSICIAFSFFFYSRSSVSVRV